MLIELFSPSVKAEALRASEYRLKIGVSLPKISGRMGRPYQPFFLSENQDE